MLDYDDYMRLKARQSVCRYTFENGDGTQTEPYELVVGEDNVTFVKDDDTIELHRVAYHPTDVQSDRPYLLNQNAVASLKAGALKESIKRELDSMAFATSFFFDYYRSEEVELTVYVLSNYVTNQCHDYPVLIKFEPKGCTLGSVKEHKLTGLTARTLSEGTVTRETVEAWRYTKLDWRDVRELSPSFVEIVLRGEKP